MNYNLKNNESDYSIIIRRQFEAQAVGLGFSVWHEVGVCGGRIDMVLGMGKGNVEEQTMVPATMTGIELKISLSDLKNKFERGKNFYSFHYNYLLIPNDIAYSAMRYVKSRTDYNHIGVIVFDENCILHVERFASYYEPKVPHDYVREYEKSMNDRGKTDYPVMDSIRFLLAQALYSDYNKAIVYFPLLHKKEVSIFKMGEFVVKEQLRKHG